MKSKLKFDPLNRKPGSRSQSMLEFALIMPILLTVVYGLTEVGRLVFMYSSIITATREAVRYGSANGMVSGLGVEQYKDCAGIKNAALQMDFLKIIDPTNIIISYSPTVANPPDYSVTIANCGGTIPNVTSGGSIRVSITAQFTPLLPMVPLDPIPLQSTSSRTIIGKVEVHGSIPPPPGSTVVAPSMTKSFLTNPVPAGTATTLRFTISNPNANDALTGVGFTDNFPSGLVRSGSPSTTCSGGTVSSTSTSVSLAGALLPKATSCTVSINVVAAAEDTYTNTSGAVTSTNAGSGNVASAILIVGSGGPGATPPQIAKTFLTNPIVAGQHSTLQFTITNPNTATAIIGVGFTDNYPAGLTQYSAPSGSQCGGSVTSTSSSITLSGGSIAASGSCIVTVSVTSSTVGVYSNTSEAVTSSNAGTGNTASADLVVGLAPPSITGSFTPGVILETATTTLNFVISNPNSGIGLIRCGFYRYFSFRCNPENRGCQHTVRWQCDQYSEFH